MKRLQNKGYAANDEEEHLSEVKFSDRKASLKQENRVACRRILQRLRSCHIAKENP